jgi:hypothetical protein
MQLSHFPVTVSTAAVSSTGRVFEFSHLHPKCAESLKLWCEFLQVIAGIILESSDQKTRGFVVQITFPQ